MAAVSRGVMLSRALQLRCPRCGEEKMFSGLVRMNPSCGHCGLKYEREPGYFLGSVYVNYGLTAMLSTVAYIILYFRFDLERKYIIWPLLAFCIIFPLFFFRYARAYWLAMDCSFDRTGFDEEEVEEPGG